MTTAIIGTGGIGSVIARRLASGGEALRLSSVDTESARAVAAEASVDPRVVAVTATRDALQDDTVVLALRFAVLEGRHRRNRRPARRHGRSRSQQPRRPRRTRQPRCVSCRKANPPARLSPGGCRQRRAWPWRLEPCLPSFSSPPATDQRSRRSYSTPPTTAVPARKSSGGSERPASSL